MSSHFNALGFACLKSSAAGRTRTAAKREESASFEPSRHVTACHAPSGGDSASCLTLTGLCSASRRNLVGRPLHVLGGKGSAPGGQTVTFDCTPTA